MKYILTRIMQYEMKTNIQFFNIFLFTCEIMHFYKRKKNEIKPLLIKSNSFESFGVPFLSLWIDRCTA